MRRLLVTGGAGFIGTNFIYYWMKKYPEDIIVAYDALTYAGHKENLSPLFTSKNFFFVKGDINDESTVVTLMIKYQIDTVVHFAAESHVDRSIEGPDVFLTTNILGTHSLLKAARRVWGDNPGPETPYRFHHVSTDEVYGSLETQEASWTEASPYEPNSPYAASKASSDHLVRAYGKTFGIPVTISHCSNNFGPYQYPEKLIPLMIHRMTEGLPLPVYGNGLHVRDWIYVEDHCLGIDLILQKGKNGEVYNLNGTLEISNLDLVCLLCDWVDQKIKEHPLGKTLFLKSLPLRGASSRDLITFVTDRKGHDFRYSLNAQKAYHTLGYQPRSSFEEALKSTIDWYLYPS